MSAIVTRNTGENKKKNYNSRSSQKCYSLVYPFKNILYNHLTGSVGKRHIVKGSWEQSGNIRACSREDNLIALRKDPFENIEAILI